MMHGQKNIKLKHIMFQWLIMIGWLFYFWHAGAKCGGTQFFLNM